MRKIASLIPVLVLLCTLAFAQTRTVKGIVRDEKGEPIPFATITEVGARNAAVADSAGAFAINVKSTSKLTVSATGFGSLTVTPGAGDVLVSLPKSAGDLQEVVVTALGIQRQKKELGYATAKLSNAEITRANAVNVANGLQGKVSGLNVTTTNNGVFEDVKINLRGIRSLTGNNNPLLVLDAVPVPIGYLSSINPNDIEDVNVLKGTGAAAIYGPDARNGVIVVTTKRGSKTGEQTITVGHSTQWSDISFFPKMQNEFGSGGYNEYIAYENWAWGPAFDGSIVDLGVPTEDGAQQTTTYSAKKDERKNFFNTGVTTQNDISFTARDFLLSIQDAKIKGIVPGDENRRTGIRMNIAKDINKWVKVGFNTNYIQSNYSVFNDDAMSDFFTAQNVGGNDGLMDLIINTAPHIPLTSYKDFNNSKFAQFNNYYNFYGYNPYWAVDNWRIEGKNESLLTSIDVNIKATDWLSFTYRAGGSFNFNTSQNFSRGEVPSDYMLSTGSANRPVPDNVGEGSFRSSRLTSDFFASFNKKFLDNNLGVGVLAGTFVRQVDVKDMRSSVGNLVVPELYNISNKAGEVIGTANRSQSRMFSYYGSVNLNWKGWVNVEVTGRNDQVSVLAPGNNTYFYPGVNAAFIPTDAFPMLKGDLISYIKVRASWNKTGNADIAPYRLGSTFSQVSGFPYGSLPGYTADDIAYDPLLKPEFIESREFGIDIGLLKNRINFEASYFNQDNTNQIVNINVSSSTGYTTAFVNAASFNNQGFEFDLRLTPLINLGDVTIDFRANASYNDSKITTIYPGLDEISIGGYTFAGNYGIVGKPAFVWKASDYERDDQGRVIVDRVSGYPTKAANLGVYGRTMPLWMVGLIPSVSWKGLSFSAVVDYKGGHYAYHDIGADMAWTGTSAATARNHRERFVVPNSSVINSSGKYDPNTNITVQDVNDFYIGVNTFRGIATNFLTSASAWRLREASLSYNFPMRVIGDPKFIKGITINLTGRNLFLWLPETNEFSDPDFNFTSEGNTSGVVDVQVNPPVRTYGFGINVRF